MVVRLLINAGVKLDSGDLRNRPSDICLAVDSENVDLLNFIILNFVKLDLNSENTNKEATALMQALQLINFSIIG